MTDRMKRAGKGPPFHEEGISAESVLAELDRILRSRPFSNAPVQQRFLRFLVEKGMGGSGTELKEYALGVEVFARGDSFDPTNDTIVRVHARRLRKRLAEYYRTEGRFDPIVIEVPKGHYRPVFRRAAPRRRDLSLRFVETCEERAGAEASVPPLRTSPVGQEEGLETIETLFDRVMVPQPRHRWQTRATGLGVLILTAGLAGAALWWWPSLDLRRARSAPLKITPFTTEGGFKQFPHFSPDGERIAYEWDGPAQDNVDIYVKALGPGSTPIRLTDNPADDRCPAWSPDGRQITFTRVFEDGTGAIYRVPSLGGQERRLVELKEPPVNPVVCWSPDGKTLIFSERETPQSPFCIVAMSIETLDKRVLTEPPEESRGDTQPEFSPDGRQIAFVRAALKVWWGRMDLWVQSLSGGDARRLTRVESNSMSHPSWTSDGRSILFNADREGSLPQVWRMDVESGQLDTVAGLGQGWHQLSVWQDRLVFVQWQHNKTDSDIRRVAIAGDRNLELETLIGSAYFDFNADISPDGSQIAFESGRSGQETVWMCNSDGTNPVQLAAFEEWSGTPRWSPDGRTIVFDSVHSGNWDLWLVNPEGGGVPLQLTFDATDENVPSWSRDGRWIYFSSTRTGRNEIFKIPSHQGRATQITQNGGWYARESRDGRYVYYTKFRELGLWRLPSSGDGEEERILPGIHSMDFDVGERGIYFAERAPHDFCISFLDTETGESTELYRRKGPFVQETGLAISRDEKWILFSERPRPTSELMLVENFR